MLQKVDSLYICSWSLRDPLCQSQSLAYIRGLVEDGYSFALITFELEQFRSDRATIEKTKKELASQGIYWYPVMWPEGNSISDKLGGIKSVLLEGIKICRRHKPGLIHSRTSLPVFAAVALKKLFCAKFLYDADSLLSEEYLDVGHMTRDSKAYKFLAWSEKWARRNADHVIVLTEELRKTYMDEFDVSVPVDVIPCCVDTEKFFFDDAARKQLRRDLEIADEPLLVYVGKTGSWYSIEETFEFYRSFLRHTPDSKLLVISKDSPALFYNVSRSVGLADDEYFIRQAQYSDIHKWLSACDAGLSLIRQVPSKKGSSPVKFAEYLSTGLPVVTTSGIGDCDDIVRRDGVGVVLKGTGKDSIDVGASELFEMLSNDHESTSKRCIDTAINRFSLSKVGQTAYRNIYQQLLEPGRKQ